MFHYDPVRPFEDRPEDYLEGGHFWLREFVTGGVFGVRMEESGMLQMQGPGGTFDAEAPLSYRRAVSALRTRFDRDAFRDAVQNVTDYEFYVLGPLSMGVDYDWTSIPPVFGLSVWDGTEDRFVPIDAAERVFEEFGLATIPTVDREIPARELAAGPDLIPDSSYADEAAAGVVLEKKQGATVSILREGFESVRRVPPNRAGRPEDFDAWLQQHVRAETVSRLILEPDRPLDTWDRDSLAEAIGTELARREFDTVGELALSTPHRYIDGIYDRVGEIRDNADP